MAFGSDKVSKKSKLSGQRAIQAARQFFGIDTEADLKGLTTEDLYKTLAESTDIYRNRVLLHGANLLLQAAGRQERLDAQSVAALILGYTLTKVEKAWIREHPENDWYYEFTQNYAQWLRSHPQLQTLVYSTLRRIHGECGLLESYLHQTTTVTRFL